MKKTLPKIVFYLFLILGIVSALTLLTRRSSAENRSDRVAFAVELESVDVLAAADGRSAEEWLADFSAMGVHYLITGDADEVRGKALAELFHMEDGRRGTEAQPGDAFLLPEEDSVPLQNAGVPLLLVEDPNRTGVNLPGDFNPEHWNGPMVKTMYMYDRYNRTYEVDDVQENENILFRGILERGLRLVIMTPFRVRTGDLSKDPPLTDVELYRKTLLGLNERLAPRGVFCGDSFSALEAPQRSFPLMVGADLLLTAAVVYLFCLVFPKTEKFSLWLLLLGLAVSLGGNFAAPNLMQRVSALGGAVIFPCYSAVLLRREMEKGQQNVCAVYFFCFLELLAVGFVGGGFVSAVLASRSYMLGCAIFSGVKLAMVMPLVFGFLWLLLGAVQQRKRGEVTPPIPKLLWVLVLLGAVAAVVLLILRSGDVYGGVPQIEIDIRNWLEYTLYARPRTKEFLFAFPMVALFLVACRQRYYFPAVPLGVATALGAVSVTNTFCHIYTPMKVSVIRTFLGAGIGFVIGFVALAVLLLIFRKKEQ